MNYKSWIERKTRDGYLVVARKKNEPTEYVLYEEGNLRTEIIKNKIKAEGMRDGINKGEILFDDFGISLTPRRYVLLARQPMT